MAVPLRGLEDAGHVPSETFHVVPVPRIRPRPAAPPRASLSSPQHAGHHARLACVSESQPGDLFLL